MLPARIYPERERLLNELHARPYASLTAPARISFLGILAGETPDAAAEERAHLVRLCARYQVAPPNVDSKYFLQDLGPFVLRWERHTEFYTYWFLREGPFDEPFADPIIGLVASDWRETLPGDVLVATHVAIEADSAEKRTPEAISRLFNHHALIGSSIAGGAAIFCTDLRLDDDGFVRFLVGDRGMNARHAGRSVQRLLEVHTYTQMALLGLPVAQHVVPQIARVEAAVAAIADRLGALSGITADREVLNEITAWAAEGERIAAAGNYRFAASRAYYELVLTRLRELREVREDGLQRLSVFPDRRLGPAMRTCEVAIRRQRDLADGISRASTLLRTRVDVAQEAQNQELLRAMSRRARLQLRLQATVEGLSVAAISYYVVGLIFYGLKALKEAGLPLKPEIITGAAIPAVAALVWFGVRHARKLVRRDEETEMDR
jgi:uncharacterized membrane-anchored protein